jgi:predicted RNase H-like HicB family nuclease
MKSKYWVIFEKTETGYSAFVPDLPGCVATGPTKEEVKKLIQETIAFHLEGLALEDIPIPQQQAEATELVVNW